MSPNPHNPFAGPQWEPWHTAAYCEPVFQSGEHTMSGSYVVYARSELQAKKTVLIHLGVTLRRMGAEVDWLS